MFKKNSDHKFKAVLFDMGGVVLKYMKAGTSKQIETESINFYLNLFILFNFFLQIKLHRNIYN